MLHNIVFECRAFLDYLRAPYTRVFPTFLNHVEYVNLRKRQFFKIVHKYAAVLCLGSSRGGRLCLRVRGTQAQCFDLSLSLVQPIIVGKLSASSGEYTAAQAALHVTALVSCSCSC